MLLYIKIPTSNLFKVIEIVKLDSGMIFILHSQLWSEESKVWSKQSQLWSLDEVNILIELLRTSITEGELDCTKYADDRGYKFITKWDINQRAQSELVKFLLAYAVSEKSLHENLREGQRQAIYKIQNLSVENLLFINIPEHNLAKLVYIRKLDKNSMKLVYHLEWKEAQVVALEQRLFESKREGFKAIKYTQNGFFVLEAEWKNPAIQLDLVNFLLTNAPCEVYETGYDHAHKQTTARLKQLNLKNPFYIRIPGKNQVKVIDITQLSSSEIVIELFSQLWSRDEARLLEDALSRSVSPELFKRYRYADDRGYLFQTALSINQAVQLMLVNFLLACAVPNNFLYEKQKQAQEKIIKRLEQLREELIKTRPFKHKSQFYITKECKENATYLRTMQDDDQHRNIVYLVNRTEKKQNYVIKMRKNLVTSEGYDESTLYELSAFFAQLALYGVGKEHVANTRVIVNKDHIPVGTRQKEIENAVTLEQAARRRTLSQTQLLKGGIIELAAAEISNKHVDSHSKNYVLDKNGNIVLFDFDRWFFTLTCYYHGFKPNDCFSMTERDWRFFPILYDANPPRWLFRPTKSGYVNNIFPYLKDIEKNPDVQYRAYKTFLRFCLLERSTVEMFGKAHLSISIRAHVVDEVMAAFADLRMQLFKLDEFKSFLAKNPHQELIADLERYNQSFNSKNACFKIDINKMRDKLLGTGFLPNISAPAVQSQPSKGLTP